MKKVLGLSVMALAVSLVSMQEASAWSNIKLGVGASFQWQTGNNAVGKCWTNGQVPGYPTNAIQGYGHGGPGYGYGMEQPHYMPPMPAPMPAPGPVPAPAAVGGLEATPVNYYYNTGYQSNYYAPTYYPAPYYYGYGQ